MNWIHLSRAMLLACSLTFLGCPPPSGPTDAPDASTSGPDASTGEPDASTGFEWDGGYVPLEETGNWSDTGRLSPCTIVPGDNTCDLSTFNLSACNTDSLADASLTGQYLLTAREEDLTSGAYRSTTVMQFNFPSDGGTPRLGSLLMTETREGNVRLYTNHASFADGGTRRSALITCESPQAPNFTGCYAFCRNGQLLAAETVKSDRLLWRDGEAESSGLGLVSESRVDIGYPVDVYVTKDHAYVVSVNQGSAKPGGLTVFDVSNKAAPVKVKTIQLTGDAYWNGVWARGNALYVASSTKGVNVFDISNPADPLFVRSVPGSNLYTHTVFVEGNRLYATANGSIALFDITTPLAPVELNRYAAPPPYYPHDVFAVGDRLYVNYAEQGYDIVDVSNPNELRTLGNFSYPGQYSHHNAVGTFAGRTIAFMGGEGPGEHLRVLDITDPAHIVKIGSFQLRAPISIHNMLLVGRKLYVAWYQEGVRVLDVSNPTRPTQVAHYNTFRESDPGRGNYYDGAIGIRVPGDGYIYVVDTSRGLMLLREP
ncbi:LVIVD repeat-containing protein [Archangium lansingense]|uniref:LVIVD repeat-containing protein n=1 Tax=Archangium lansingense TaxID=2995310 RepID=UPI003B7B3B92